MIKGIVAQINDGLLCELLHLRQICSASLTELVLRHTLKVNMCKSPSCDLLIQTKRIHCT